MRETIHDGKFVELTYKVTDRKSGHVLTCVEFPLGYIHGHNEILAPSVHRKLEGKSAQQMVRLMEALDEHDDVQHVWSNFDIEEKEIEASLA